MLRALFRSVSRLFCFRESFFPAHGLTYLYSRPALHRCVSTPIFPPRYLFFPHSADNGAFFVRVLFPFLSLLFSAAYRCLRLSLQVLPTLRILLFLWAACN